MGIKTLALIIGLALGGCVSASGSFCDIEKPSRFSAEAIDAMSLAEVQDVVAHNRKGQELCGWAP